MRPPYRPERIPYLGILRPKPLPAILHDNAEISRALSNTCIVMQAYQRAYNLKIVPALGVSALFAALLLPGLRVLAEQPVMRLYTTEDGLARNWLTRIRRDSRGRLWFCTVEGLSLFDGRRFANYNTSDGLPHRLVTDILEAGDGSYWLTTGAGLYRFRPRAAQPASFERVPLTGASEAGAADVLLRTRAGELWCGADKGLYRIQQGVRPEGVAVPLADAAHPDIPYPDILALADGPDGALWIGTVTGLIRRRADGALAFWPSAKGYPWAVKALLFDREGMLWAGGDGGFFTLDSRREPPAVQRYSFHIPHPLYGVQSFYLDSRGQFWIGALGLVRLERGDRKLTGSSRYRFRFFDRHSPLGSQYCFDMTEDADGNLWAALSNLGAARVLRPGFSQFTEADGLETKAVLSVFESNNGKIFAVTGQRHALNEFDGERFRQICPRVPPSLTYFGFGEGTIELQDRRGEWWMATGQALLRYPRVARPADLAHTTPRRYTKADGLPDLEITRLFEDRRGDIWTGTASGVARWSAANQAFENLTSALRRVLDHVPIPQSFAEDAAGRMWIGFYEGGLVRWRDGSPEPIRKGLPSGSINALLTDRKGRLWVASSQQGLACIDEPTALSPQVRVYEAHGLRSKHLFALAEDHDGRIYVAGGHGVDRLDPATGSVYHFDVSFLPPGETHRLYCDRQGAIWFASNFGLSRYIPEPDPIVPPPAPLIHEVRVSGVSRLASDEGESRVAGLNLPAGKESFEITWGNTDFAVGSNLRYRYRLVPAETEWRESSAQRSVQYAGVGSGDYRFEVQTVGPSGLASAAIARVEFHIAAPFWKTWWFLTLSGASVAALVMAAHLYRARHLLALERVRSHLAADLHDDLGGGLTEIAILAEVARQQGKTADLEVVAQRARELRGAMGDIVWSVNPECDNLEELIRRWRQTAFALLANEALEFNAPAAAEAARIELSPDRRRQLLLLFKEVVANAARHAQASRVWVDVRLAPSWLNLEVRDDGCGFEPDRAAGGNGLKNMAARAASLRGTVKIDSAPGRGTTVRLSAPLRESRGFPRPWTPARRPEAGQKP